MNSLTELTADLESQLSKFDENMSRIAAISGALENLEKDAQTVRSNGESLDLASRSKKLAQITTQTSVLKFDIEALQAETGRQRKAIVAAASDLRNRCIGETAGRAQARNNAVVAELKLSFDVKKIMFPIAQIAEAHRSVQDLREVERALSSIDSTDESRIAFARRVRTEFLGKLV